MALTEISPNKPREQRKAKVSGGTGLLNSFASRYRTSQGDKHRYQEVVKDHHRHIARLVQAKKLKEGMAELHTMYIALTDPQLRFREVPLSRLLHGTFESTAEFQIVNAFHLLLLQTLIQYVSGNLQSIVAGENGFSEAIFGTIALSLKREGSIVRWIEKSPTNVKTKAYTSLGKVCGGFLKIVDFLSAKVQRVGLKDHRMNWELLQIKFRRLAGETCDVSLPKHASGPFLQDLNDSIDSEPTSPCLEQRDPQDCLQYVLRELRMDDTDAKASPQLLSEALLKVSSLSPTDKNADIIESMLHAFRDTKITDPTILRDALIGFVRAAAPTPVFPRLLQNIIPALLQILPADKELLSLCFRYGNEHGNQDALLLVLKHLPDSVDPEKKQRFREVTLKCLLNNGRLEQSWDIVVKFLEDHKFSDMNIFEGTEDLCIPESVLRCLVLNVSSNPQLLQNDLLTSLNDHQKGSIFVAALDCLEESEITSAEPFFCFLNHCDPAIKLFCQWRLEKSTGAQLRLSDVSKGECEIIVAAILSNRLECVSGALKPRLQEILRHFERWLDGELKSAHEIDTLIEVMRSLFYTAHYATATKMLTSFVASDHYRRASTDSKLALQFMSLRCLLELGDIDTFPAHLSEAGKLIKDLSLLDKSVERHLIEWKLYQYDYFISTESSNKAQAKFEELNQILGRRSELRLDESSSTNLDRTISFLLLGAHFLKLSAKHQSTNGDFVSTLRNCKKAIKIATSVLKKFSRPDIVRKETIHLLFDCYKQSFEAARHIGASNECCNMLHEMGKLHSGFDSVIVQAMTSFELSDMLFSAGEIDSSVRHYQEGLAEASTSDSCPLRVAQLRSSILQNILSSSKGEISSVGKQILHTFRGIPGELEAFSIKKLKLSFVSIDYLLSDEELISSILEYKCQSRRLILLNALLAAKREVGELKASILDQPSALVIPSGLTSAKERAEADLILFEKLLDNKEALLKFLENNYSQHLGLEEVAKLQEVLSQCVCTLSQMSVLRSDGAESLLRDVYFLQDMPRHLPFSNSEKLHQDSKEDNNLLPSRHNASIDNLQARDTFYQRLDTLLPDQYLIITIDIAADTGDLSLTRYSKSSKSPSIFQLSMRESNREDTASFASVIRELSNIIRDSHQTTNLTTTSNVKTKEDRRHWWKRRFELDARMKTLLDDVETNWIGGFKGIFERGSHSKSEFVFFKSELQRAWQKALNLTSPLDLSDTITELYLNVQVCKANYSFDKSLEDLIIYTASELQVTVNYKKLAKDLKKIYPRTIKPSHNQHIVLIPGHACSEFPWESLEFLRERSISRVPSVEMLLQLLENSASSIPSEHDLFYMLNPGGDLKKTEERFKDMFQSMPRSRGIVGQAPEEDKLITSLFNTDLFFYAGHGGGEQYMRMSQVKKIRFCGDIKLPPALLMGCSSGALQKFGRLEPTSNTMVWLLCGSPMIVSNLWDITDKDIDVFSSSALAKWGLMGKDSERLDIARAVSESRNTCVLKYLNGAAPIVHGLPIRLE